MLKHINGLHHITSMAGDARQNNHFFTRILGLRRVKKTVNFDAPDVYHLYYGDTHGTPGSIMTYFPFPNIAAGKPGTGEVGTTLFSIPEGSSGWWHERLLAKGVNGLKQQEEFGSQRLYFAGPDGDGFALVETLGDERKPWANSDIPSDYAIRGFFGATMRLADTGAMTELLHFMNYSEIESGDGVSRYKVNDHGNGANFIELEHMPSIARARLGAGSVHHIAYSVANRQAQEQVRKALMDTGYQVTPVIDRDYFWAIYFRTPDGVLFEIATNEPGFDRDEDTEHLGQALKIPQQHAHLRTQIEQILPSLEG